MGKIKPAVVEYKGELYLRIPVRTHEIKPPDDLKEVLWRYVGGLIRPGDILVLSSKAVASAQGRLVSSKDIKPRKIAHFLARKVKKVPYGIGLGSPETMEMAIRECGLFRILFASAFGFLGKILGIKGLFYLVAGRQAAWIDGDAPYGVLRGYVVLGPREPWKTCRELQKFLGVPVAIMDVNDIGGCEICGASPGVSKDLLLFLMKDNPLGQDVEYTPIGILRKIPKQ
ncbi:MAG: coenzyme F420-0:L-glutamate ligase [Caldiserica bacterium]|jgi:F420-0:gamma-glutamyl ligase-like protein|nr:coenzyme F420-0:L-glutamate ligase [Caldisericota bacterium]MDH7562776.1 coenzyme F420-0:L-glutamate ligase [Caldisericota bacterium]